MTTENKERRGLLSRRDFGLSLAALAATPLLGGVAHGEPVMTRDAGPTGATQAADEKIAPEAEALAEIVRLRYGKELSDEQMEAVKRSLNNRVQASARLKQFKLKNGDEPAFVFSANPD